MKYFCMTLKYFSKNNILLTFESFLVDTFDVVVVQLENTQIRKTGDGARGDAADLVVGQVSAIENI